MKRTIALLLSLIMVLSLCACGDSGTAAPVEENELKLNEPITVDDYEFTITETEFDPQYFDGFDYKAYKSCGNGNVHFVVKTTFKNVGKEEISIPSSFLTLEYGDGYSFSPSDTYYFSFDVLSYVSNAWELPALSKAKPCITYFEVPEEVQNNTDEPLKLKIMLADTEIVCNLR